LVKSARTAVLGSQKAGRNLEGATGQQKVEEEPHLGVDVREAELRGPPRDHSIETLFL